MSGKSYQPMRVDRESEIKRWLIRAWGNAKIAEDLNKLPYFVMRDLDRLANAYGLTEADKEYAVRLMDGDVYTRIPKKPKK